MGFLMLPLKSSLILLPSKCVLCSKVLSVMTWGVVNVLQAHCWGRYSRVILYGTHSSLDIQAFVYVWPVNLQAQLPPGRRSGAFCRADDLLMWIPVRQKGKCLCFQDSLVSRVSTAVTLSPVLPKPSRPECNTISSSISSADALR